jgi:hypothetical protein
LLARVAPPPPPFDVELVVSLLSSSIIVMIGSPSSVGDERLPERDKLRADFVVDDLLSSSCC